MNEENEITLANNLASKDPLLDTAHLANNGIYKYPSLYIALPVLPKFELILDTKNGLKMRYQVLGSTRNTSKVGDLSSVIALGFTYANTERIKQDISSPYSLYKSATYDWKLTTYSAEIIFGTLIRENVLLYGGPFFSSYDFEGELNQIASNEFSDPNTEFYLKSRGGQSGFGIAFEFLFESLSVEQGLVYNVFFTKISWDDYISNIQVSHGISIRYHL